MQQTLNMGFLLSYYALTKFSLSSASPGNLVHSYEIASSTPSYFGSVALHAAPHYFPSSLALLAGVSLPVIRSEASHVASARIGEASHWL
jgi:hypothetical protein